MKYIIVNGTMDHLVNLVNKMINDGWLPLGPPQRIRNYIGRDNKKLTCMAQAMTKDAPAVSVAILEP